MSVTLYDKALLQKLQHWIKDDKVTITGVNDTKTLFRYRADIKDDKPIQLPLISLSRLSPISVLVTNKRPLTFNGARTESQVIRDPKGNIVGKTNQLNAIPISIKYQLDIYTRYEEEAEEYVRNFIFNLINFPKVTFEIPYNSSHLLTNSYIQIDSDINDTSEIPERLIAGQFSRRTISFTLSDAYLYDFRAVDNITIKNIEVKVHLDELDESSQIVIEDVITD